MQIKRIAVISGATDRAEGVAAASRNALARVATAEHLRWAELRALSQRDFDFYLYIGHEIPEEWPNDLRPAACWLIDRRELSADCTAAATNFDHVFAGRRSIARFLGRRSLNAHWLPPACEPIDVDADEVRRLKDVILIGDRKAEQFKATAELLCKRLSARYIVDAGNAGSKASYLDGRIVACVGRPSCIDFEQIEVIAKGALLLIEQSEAADLLESCRDAVHYVSYCGPHELLAQITFYLKRHDLWHRISRAGRLHAIRNGSYDARMQRLLHVCAASLSTREPRVKPAIDSTAAKLPGIIAGRTAARSTPSAIASAWCARPSGPDLVLVRDRPSISLCMIVRDSARTLGRCLRSIRPWVSEMIVVDTGSLDGTPELARRLGARVFHFPWCCDFAAARNESIRHAHGKWIFWMDADDVIDGNNGRGLMKLAAAPSPPNLLGCVLQVHCPGGRHGGDVTAVDHVKLFMNRPDLRFQGRIHEQILPAIRAAGGEVGWTDLFVVHSGADYSPAGRRRKFARDVGLLELELRDRPDHSFTLFNLGMTHADIGEHATAVEYLHRSLEKSETGESHIRKIYALLAASLSHLQRNREAYETCVAGLNCFPMDAELNFRAAIAAHRLGKFEQAERLYRSVIAGGDSRHFSSVDRGITGFKAHYNLAGVYRDMGKIVDAQEQYQIVTRTVPQWGDGWRALLNLRSPARCWPRSPRSRWWTWCFPRAKASRSANAASASPASIRRSC